MALFFIHINISNLQGKSLSTVIEKLKSCENFNISVMEFLRMKASSAEKSSSSLHNCLDLLWKPPPNGWIKINVDTAHN